MISRPSLAIDLDPNYNRNILIPMVNDCWCIWSHPAPNSCLWTLPCSRTEESEACGVCPVESFGNQSLRFLIHKNFFIATTTLEWKSDHIFCGLSNTAGPLYTWRAWIQFWQVYEGLNAFEKKVEELTKFWGVCPVLSMFCDVNPPGCNNMKLLRD